VSIACTIACAIAGAAAAIGGSNDSVHDILKAVEDRYNKTQTLEVAFTEKFSGHGRSMVNKGDLFLRKPGRMRWQYTSPAGQLYISDGKFIYAYYPNENKAEKMAFKEADDMKAPLAFLLGRLNFQNDFKEFHAQPDRDNTFITAIPKSDKLPYSEVTFLVSPDAVIHWLRVKEQDGSTIEFTFENEKRNPPVADTLFHFTAPPGVEFSDLTKQ
jgi:outer membrane lipoprotein carrier protein